jgi:hypothetical protein
MKIILVLAGERQRPRRLRRRFGRRTAACLPRYRDSVKSLADLWRHNSE